MPNARIRRAVPRAALARPRRSPFRRCSAPAGPRCPSPQSAGHALHCSPRGGYGCGGFGGTTASSGRLREFRFVQSSQWPQNLAPSGHPDPRTGRRLYISALALDGPAAPTGTGCLVGGLGWAWPWRRVASRFSRSDALIAAAPAKTIRPARPGVVARKPRGPSGVSHGAFHGCSPRAHMR
jgi:hypothetical protein